MFDPKLNIIARNHRACQTFLLSLYKPNRTLFVLLFWRRIRSQVVITTQKFNILCLWKNTKTRLHKQKAETLSLRNCTRWFGFVACSLKGKHRGHFIWLKFGRCTRTVACLVCCLVSLFVGLAFSRFSWTLSGVFNEISARTFDTSICTSANERADRFANLNKIHSQLQC